MEGPLISISINPKHVREFNFELRQHQELHNSFIGHTETLFNLTHDQRYANKINC